MSSFSVSSRNNLALFATSNTFHGTKVFDGTYEIALTDICYPRNWKTIDDSKCFIRKLFNVIEDDMITVDIPGKHITTYDELVLYVNTLIEKSFKKQEPEDSVCPKITFLRERNIFCLHTGYGQKSNMYVLEFTDDLQKLFGFENYGEQVIDVRDVEKLMAGKSVSYHTSVIPWEAVPKAYRTRTEIPEVDREICQIKKDRVQQLKAQYNGFENFSELFSEKECEYDIDFRQVFKFFSTNPQKLKPKHPVMYVGCNLVQRNNKLVDEQLLRVIYPDNYEFEEDVAHESYGDLRYFPLVTASPTEIEIKIKQQNGNWFPFEGNARTGARVYVICDIRKKV